MGMASQKKYFNKAIVNVKYIFTFAAAFDDIV